MSKVKRNTGNLLMSLTEIIIGILLLINPVGFTTGIIVTLGVLMAILGIESIVGYFRATPEEAAEVSGINKVQWAVDMLRQKQKYWFIALIGAVLSLVFAVLVLANPFSSTVVLWTFIAVSLIIEAVVDILAFIFGRKQQ